MEGSGVTNYDVQNPTYAYTAATTEFDEALIKRGIIPREAALIAKGATLEQAQTILTQASSTLYHGQNSSANGRARECSSSDLDSNDNNEDNDDDLWDDDDVMARFRQERLAAMQVTSHRRSATSSGLVHISRQEWMQQVNEASHHAWVLVCLSSSDTERTGCLEQAIQQLATTITQRDDNQYDSVLASMQFVMIPAQSAIENWPHDNLPTLFLYRHGKMQQDWIRLPIDMTLSDVKELLLHYFAQRDEAPE